MTRLIAVVLIAVFVVACEVSSTTAPDPIPPCRFQVASFGVVVDRALVQNGVLTCRVAP